MLSSMKYQDSDIKRLVFSTSKWKTDERSSEDF